MNNPIGFLNGSIKNAQDYAKDLLRHLALYQQHYPDPVAPLQDHAEDIDLEFLSEDLPKLLDSMKGATDEGAGFILPTRNSALFRWCLQHGLRVVQSLTLMSLGFYNQPAGAFLPSILF